uniref:Uncharacterized protein n=1 Tax=Arundo donax TaxID=35708 RepID=A0A0A9HFQ3_ARUDO
MHRRSAFVRGKSAGTFFQQR